MILVENGAERAETYKIRLENSREVNIRQQQRKRLKFNPQTQTSIY